MSIDALQTNLLVEIIEHIPNKAIRRTMLRKSAGMVSIKSKLSNDCLPSQAVPFDMIAQIIEGNVEIIINKESHLLLTGKSILIPAHSLNFIRSNWRFKMILTTLQN